MSMRNDIKEIIDHAGWNLTEVLKASNKKHNQNFTLQNLSKKLGKETITHKEILDIAEIIGYEIKWEKKQTNG